MKSEKKNILDDVGVAKEFPNKEIGKQMIKSLHITQQISIKRHSMRLLRPNATPFKEAERSKTQIKLSYPLFSTFNVSHEIMMVHRQRIPVTFWLFTFHSL